MASKPGTDLIDELLRVDEDELRAKKGRLRAFQAALDGLRQASSALAETGAAILAAGDVSRLEASKVFNLSKAERSIAFGLNPTSRSTPDVVGINDPIDDPADPEDHPAEQTD